MPGFSGEQTLRALRDRSPDLPIIIMSGYSESALKDDSVRFLPKPFRLDELIKAVEEALATPAEI